MDTFSVCARSFPKAYSKYTLQTQCESSLHWLRGKSCSMYREANQKLRYGNSSGICDRLPCIIPEHQCNRYTTVLPPSNKTVGRMCHSPVSGAACRSVHVSQSGNVGQRVAAWGHLSAPSPLSFLSSPLVPLSLGT